VRSECRRGFPLGWITCSPFVSSRKGARRPSIRTGATCSANERTGEMGGCIFGIVFGLGNRNSRHREPNAENQFAAMRKPMVEVGNGIPFSLDEHLIRVSSFFQLGPQTNRARLLFFLFKRGFSENEQMSVIEGRFRDCPATTRGRSAFGLG
jgi:hypothetical protein